MAAGRCSRDAPVRRRRPLPHLLRPGHRDTAPIQPLVSALSSQGFSAIGPSTCSMGVRKDSTGALRADPSALAGHVEADPALAQFECAQARIEVVEIARGGRVAIAAAFCKLEPVADLLKDVSKHHVLRAGREAVRGKGGFSLVGFSRIIDVRANVTSEMLEW